MVLLDKRKYNLLPTNQRLPPPLPEDLDLIAIHLAFPNESISFFCICQYSRIVADILTKICMRACILALLVYRQTLHI